MKSIYLINKPPYLYLCQQEYSVVNKILLLILAVLALLILRLCLKQPK